MRKLQNDYLIITLIMVLASLVVFLAPTKVEAVEVKSADVVPCVSINTAEFEQGTIDILYCEPTVGQPYKINSLGFMLNE
jgi:hypothetical protein